MLYSCDKFVKQKFTDDPDSPYQLVSNISPVIGLPKYLGEEITIHLAYTVDTSSYVFDKTFTAIQDGDNLRWSESGVVKNALNIKGPYNLWEITFAFNSKHITFNVTTSGGENNVVVTEFSINGIPVTQRE